MQVLTRRYRRRDPRQGVAFVWFSLVAMPFLFLGMAFAADFTRIVMLGHQMQNATNSASLAAAWEFQPGTVVLDRGRATRVARETYCQATGYIRGHAAVGWAGSSGVSCDHDIALSVRFSGYNSGADPARPGTGYTTVTATAHYQITDTIFFAYFGQGRSFEAPPVSVSAAVCVPGDRTGYTSGWCARPDDPPLR